MGDVLIRQWGPGNYAAFVVTGAKYPTFVGIEPTRAMAREFAESVLADPVECSRRCWYQTDLDGALGLSEQVFLREWSEESDGPRKSTTPARRAPVAPGASP